MNRESLFDISLYNDDFFAWHFKYARDYSIKTMDWYINQFKPKSVIDFGCGIGSYLESAYNNGITELKGYDLGWKDAKKYCPVELHKFIQEQDCTQAIESNKYDCVISFETIEHIEPIGTNVFIDNLINAVDKNGVILFTGAPPDQDGCGHINCREKDAWELLFTERGCFLDSNLNSFIVDGWRSLNVGCPNYILNNLLTIRKIA